jgi:hypothetical protein
MSDIRDLDRRALAVTVKIAGQVPGGAYRERPGAQFKQVIDVSEDATPQDKLVATRGSIWCETAGRRAVARRDTIQDEERARPAAAKGGHQP